MKVLGCCCVAFAGLAMAQNAGVNTNDRDFVREAAIGGMMEVQMGRIALQKGTNEQVKALGQRLVDDHTRLDDQLRQLAAQDNFMLPAQLDPKHQAEVNRFRKMAAGTAFDRDFVRDAISDHTGDIANFQSEAANGNNKDLKNFASSALPTLQDHLAKAQAAQIAVGITSSTRPPK